MRCDNYAVRLYTHLMAKKSELYSFSELPEATQAERNWETVKLHMAALLLGWKCDMC